MANKYRKKPVVIEAIRYIDHEASRLEVREFVTDLIDEVGRLEHNWTIEIYNSAEQCWIPIPKGHWIIKGVMGEFYPCDPEIFKATYEAVDVGT